MQKIIFRKLTNKETSKIFGAKITIEEEPNGYCQDQPTDPDVSAGTCSFELGT
ncbi:MAG: hypothetical protein GY757_27315 [bacterium]|nr:hypothetical protein [bacterium]